MKWLSVKKYKPVNDCIVLIRRVHNNSQFHEIILATMQENGLWQEVESEKFMQDEYEVTHFCIPDPIEIEETND